MIDVVKAELIKIGFEPQNYGEDFKSLFQKRGGTAEFLDSIDSLVKPIWRFETNDGNINTLLVVAARKELNWSAAITQRIKKRNGEIQHSGGIVCHLLGPTPLVIKKFSLIVYTLQMIGLPNEEQQKSLMDAEFHLFKD